MSLMDALLLEGFGDPKQIFITVRADGQRGSGGISDPYDGGTRQGAQISGAALSYAPKEVIVITSGYHGYTTGQSVAISGVTGPGASEFNQTFSITVLNSREFKFTLNNVPAAPPAPRNVITATAGGTAQSGVRLSWPVALIDTGSANNGLVPFDAVAVSGASDAAFNGNFVAVGVEATRFRYRLTNSLTNISGANPGTSCSFAKIIHRLDEVLRAAPANAIIRLSGTFETRGICSAYNSNPSDYSQLYVGYAVKAGQKLIGGGLGATVLKIVFASDPITLTVAVGSFLDVSAFEARDLTVDANLPNQPIPAAADFAPVACGAVGCGGSFMRLERIRAINFGTQAYPECFVLALSGKPPNGPTRNVIEGCIVEKPSENNTHETTLITNVGPDAVVADARAALIHNCFVNCVYQSSGVSSEIIAVSAIDSQPVWNATRQQYEFTVTTKRPHNRVVGNNLAINSISPPDHVLNGSFTVVALGAASATQVICRSPQSSFVTFDASTAFIGVGFNGPSALSGSGGVVEGNAVYDCQNPFYTDTGSTRSVVLRNNYYSNLLYGVNQNFNPHVGPGETPRDGTSLTHVGNLATYTASDAHRLTPRQAVDITGALINGSLSNLYNGTFVVETISSTDPKVFSYRMGGTPTANADTPTPSTPLRFAARWQTFYLLIENNVYDLYQTDSNSVSVTFGILTYGYEQCPPYMFPEIIARENTIRHRDGLASGSAASGYLSAGIRLDSAGSALLQENVMDVENTNPIQHLNSGSVKSFNNSTAAGLLIRGHTEVVPDDSAQKDDELATAIEGAVLLAFY